MAHLVIDTNVLISAIITPNGAGDRVLGIALRRYEIAQTLATFSELERCLARPEFVRLASARFRRKRLSEIRRASAFLRVEPGLPLSRDADDDKFLHLAAAADAVALVTGDRDLLVLGEFAGIPILSPSRFLRAERSIRRGRQARGG
jgi:hypothetical protein